MEKNSSPEACRCYPKQDLGTRGSKIEYPKREPGKSTNAQMAQKIEKIKQELKYLQKSSTKN
tara:strand:+ start:439 stop:624 length:186 start_codon:yes stop_codon:yes gene_type:complete